MIKLNGQIDFIYKFLVGTRNSRLDFGRKLDLQLN